MLQALEMKKGSAGRGPGDRITNFLSTKAIKPFAIKYLKEVIIEPIKFRTPAGQIAHGYEATILTDICDAVLEARRVGYQKEIIKAESNISYSEDCLKALDIQNLGSIFLRY